MKQANRAHSRLIRHRRIRAKITGSATRPRLVVHRGLKQLSAQLIDDVAGQTLASASTRQLKLAANQATARQVGQELAKLAQQKGISAVVFDRAGYSYHGQVKALAEAAREGGLKF